MITKVFIFTNIKNTDIYLFLYETSINVKKLSTGFRKLEIFQNWKVCTSQLRETSKLIRKAYSWEKFNIKKKFNIEKNFDIEKNFKIEKKTLKLSKDKYFGQKPRGDKFYLKKTGKKFTSWERVIHCLLLYYTVFYGYYLCVWWISSLLSILFDNVNVFYSILC